MAHELVLLAVCPQMHVEGIGMGEHLSISYQIASPMRAKKGLIQSIFSDGDDFHLSTYVTCLQPLSCVNSHVVFQLLLLGEHNLEEMNVASTFDVGTSLMIHT